MKTRIVVLVLIVIASLLQTTTIRAQATHPAYLSQMPTVARVKTEIKGSDMAETAARQMGAFLQFKKMIEDIAWGTERRYTNRLTPDEKRLSDEYYAAYGRIWVTTDQKFTALRDYDIDPRFRDELLVKFFSPEFRAAFYRAIRQQPTGPPQNAQPSGPSSAKPTATAGTSADAHLSQGYKYRDAEDYPKAIQAFKKAIAIKPAVSEGHFNLGYSYYRLKQYQNALPEFQEAVRLKRTDNSNHFWLGATYYYLDQYQKALAAFQESARLKPKDPNSHYWLGEVYANGFKQFEKAVPEYLEARQLNPTDARNINQLGLAYDNLRQYENSLAAAREAVRLQPSESLYHYNLGIAYLRMNRNEEAGHVYKTLLPLDKAKAQALYEEITKPTTSQPTNNSGNPAGESAGSAGRPAHPGRRASPVQAAPGNPSGPRQPSASAGTGASAYETEGDKYLEGKDYTKAIQAYKKAIALEPSRGVAYGGLALAYNAQGEYQLAISAWKQAQTLMRFEASDFILLGDAHLELKQYDEALKEFRSAISLKPDSQLLSYAHYGIGYSYIKLTKYNDALVALRESVRIAPDYVHALYELGFAYMLTAQFPSAVTAYERVIRLKPDHAEARFHLGFTYVLMGKKEEALQVYRTLQRLDKKLAQELLAEINKMK